MNWDHILAHDGHQQQAGHDEVLRGGDCLLAGLVAGRNSYIVGVVWSTGASATSASASRTG